MDRDTSGDYGNRHPMAVWWGGECVHLYNDAYRPILGDKLPASLAGTGEEVWADSWALIRPMAEGLLRHDIRSIKSAC